MDHVIEDDVFYSIGMNGSAPNSPMSTRGILTEPSNDMLDDVLENYGGDFGCPMATQSGHEPRDESDAEAMDDSSDSADAARYVSLKQLKEELRTHSRPRDLQCQGAWIVFSDASMRLDVELRTGQVFVNMEPMDGILLAADLHQLCAANQVHIFGAPRVEPPPQQLTGESTTLTFRNRTTGVAFTLHAWRPADGAEWLVRMDAVEKKKKAVRCAKWIECDPRVAHTGLFNAMRNEGFVGGSAHSIRVARVSDLQLARDWEVE